VRIGFDISHSVGQRSGLGSYSIGLLKGLARVATEEELLAYSFFYERFPAGWRQAKLPNAANVKLNDPELPERLLRRKLRAGGLKAESLWGDVDIIHSNANVAPLLEHSRLVFTVFDTTIYLFPELHTAWNYDLVNRNLHSAARNAAALIAISQQTREDLQRFLHVPDDRVTVVYGAADERFHVQVGPEEIERVKRKHNIQGEYILAVGTLEPRKNLVRLVLAFRKLVEKGCRHRLVLAGQRGWLNDELYNVIAGERLGDKVQFTGYVDDNDLPPLYSGASVFAYPSLYEGFGLPLIEALACGAPTVTSKRSSLPEVAGNAALLVNPEDEDEIADALLRLIEDHALREDLSMRAREQSRRFSWEQSAREALAVYKRVMEQRE